jgi:hypothetical protein
MTTPPCHRRVASLAACLLAFAVVTAWPVAAAQIASGADVKAAFLFNFSKFVEWPTDASAGPFVFGILGDDAVADALRDLARGKAIAGRPLLVKNVAARDDLTALNIIFVGDSESARLADIIKRTNGGSVLTVSDLARFCDLGGMIQFRSENDRVRFDINLDAAEAGGLAINSKLLALARAVHSTKTR